MIGRRNIIIAVGTIVIFAAMVGFFITLDVSPQIAYARLFIDLGLAIGLIAVIMAFYKEKPLPVESIIQAIKSLKAGKYKTRITLAENNPLISIANSLNELAKNLEMEQKKQDEIKRNLREELLPGFKQKEATLFEHSIHPELGPVLKIGPEKKASTIFEKSITSENKVDEPVIVTKEQKYKNTLIDSNPPVEEGTKLAPFVSIEEQDLGELYQQFIDAQRANNLHQIEYPTFLKTIEATRNELIDSYKCRAVVFNIVSEKTQVALQPKIIR